MKSLVAMICGLLCLAVVLVFCQTGGHAFVNFDDDHYVYDNEHINRGFTWDGLIYYACHWHAYTYHPLTTYSHMLDCQLFGLKKAGGHHGMNVALHAITAALLFLLLRQMTGRLWPCALAAALFAIHPLRVESVAWIAERKDVLSGLFFVLTLGAYVRYVRAPAARSVGILPASAGRYATVCALYALGLLAKPMLVTLPMVLLLLDYWPLRRWRREPAGSGRAPCTHGRGAENCDAAQFGGKTDVGDAAELQESDAGKMPTLQAAWHVRWHLLIEKIPLLLFAAADSALTVRTQVAAIKSLESIPLLTRIDNALAAYVSYLGCFFWPRDLAILYPHPNNVFSARTAFLAAAILAVVSAGVFVCRRQAPYLLVGWLWYLGMLVPVIGLIQVGGQAMADRYTYLPQIGLVLGLVWAVADLIDCLPACAGAAVRRTSRLLGALGLAGAMADLTDLLAVRTEAAVRRAGRFFGALVAAGIIAALAVSAWQQTGYWYDSVTLWGRDMMYPNAVAHYNFGLALAAEHRHKEAIQQFERAYAINPTDEDTLVSYGQSLEVLGRIEEAVTKFHAALAVNENSVIANDHLARILRSRGKEK